jgi:RHS repeat-associated protein
MMKLLLVMGFAAWPAAAATSYVIPVVSARVHDRVYTTTLALRNDGPADVTCESVYAVPNDPTGKVFQATIRLPAGEPPHVEEDLLSGAGAVGSVRFECTAPVAMAARIQSSSDGGLTFDAGRTFSALSQSQAVPAGASTALTARGDVVIAEVRGRAVTVEAVVKNAGDVVFTRKTLEIPAFAQQVLNLSKVHADLKAPTVEIRITKGDGAIVAADETREPGLLRMAVRMPAQSRAVLAARQSALATTATNTPVAPSVFDGIGFSRFKAAPYEEKALGLIYMRKRWYDPKTGSFLSPDPAGYRDSANLYSYCHGDPVNCSDPTGLADTRLLTVGKPGQTADVSEVTFDSRSDYFDYLIANGVSRERALEEVERSVLPYAPLTPETQRTLQLIPSLYHAQLKAGARIWTVTAAANLTGGTATAFWGTGTLGIVGGGASAGVVAQGTGDVWDRRASSWKSYIFAAGTGVLFNFGLRGLGAYEPDAVPSIGEFAPPTRQFAGGAHKELSTLGLQRHHMPADSVSPISTAKGPAIEIMPEDHMLTASWGRSRAAMAYRARQKELISEGRFAEAMQMDINDSRVLFGRKYDEAIDQMLKYASTLDPAKTGPVEASIMKRK